MGTIERSDYTACIKAKSSESVEQGDSSIKSSELFSDNISESTTGLKRLQWRRQDFGSGGHFRGRLRRGSGGGAPDTGEFLKIFF